MEQNTIIKPKRVFSFDILRIIAVVAVISIHMSVGYVQSYDISSLGFICGNIVDSISRLAVPLFVMLSGALMLNEDKNITMKKMLKNALRLFYLLCFWSFFYAFLYEIVDPLSLNKSISLKSFIEAFVLGHYHLWYLYMLIGLYLITPILRLFVKKANHKYILYFILLSIIFQFIVSILNLTVTEIFNMPSLINNFIANFKFGFVTGYITYYLIGWYVANIEIGKKYRIIIYISGIVGLLVTIIGTQLLSNYYTYFTDMLYSNYCITILSYSLAVFVFFYYLFKDKNCEKVSPITTKLSNLTFGVYVIHAFILSILTKYIPIDFGIFEMPINIALTTIISFVISFIISKIPFVKKIIRC